MHAEKLSEIIAHFIGMFETHTDAIELRQHALDGQIVQDANSETPDQPLPQDQFSSDLTLIDFSPNVKYVSNAYEYDHLQARLYDETFHATLKNLTALAQEELAPIRDPADLYIATTTFGAEQKLHVDHGQGSEIAHVMQVNVVRDDDILDMTNGHHPVQDLSYILDQLAEMNARADALSPFSSIERTDSPDALTKIGDDMHDFAQTVEQNGGTSVHEPDGSGYVIQAAQVLDGIHVNGADASDLPDLNDYMPQPLLTPSGEPTGSDTRVHSDNPSGNSLTIETGGNEVVNIATVVDTGIIAPVMAVMGDYHSVDAISQIYTYADHDKVEGLLDNDASSPASAQTIGKNIAVFEHSQFANDPTSHPGSDGSDPVFPTAWHVSVVDGDVSFVHWTEQYNFLSDNDSLTVTTSGVDTTVLTGNNGVADLASYLGIGMQYDLVIVGGHVLDMNSITQISVLYDSDTVKLDGTRGAEVQTGGNLLWNQAAIQNIGGTDRFEAMPDYMNDVVKNIQDRDASMPEGLAHDPTFAGYAGLSVLYITGNFYDVNVIKQVNVVGDGDSVTKIANETLHDNHDATVKIDTGSNAVVNIASIIDYDSFGHTTYVAGHTYSDAILIQGGLIDHDGPAPNQPVSQLANEAIAFLDDNNDQQTGQDGTVDLGHDLSWHNGSVGDPMHSVLT
jgi:hypothetical protein